MADQGVRRGRPPHVTLAVAALILPVSTAWAQAYFIPGDPKAGMQIFSEKGCMHCHAVLGEGGRSAPDLARAPAGHLSAAELVSAMWNHAPAMWEKMSQEKLAVPKFSTADITNLFAFLYSVRALDKPGDAERGRRLLSEKRCLECHAIAGQGGPRGPDLKTWASHRNPVSWIQAMWNHGPAMQALMTQRGLSWPEFRGDDMADMIACIRELAANPKARAQLRQADPERGRQVFQAKRCDACHAVRGGGGGGPDLGARTLPRTLGQFAALMWNHAPAMWSTMRLQGLARPQFSNQEMADLIAYLFTQRYFEPAGDAGRGRRIFENKSCARCHFSGGSAPDLSAWRGKTSVVPLAAALWNHGPLMLAHMRQRQFSWPRFRPGEIVDLIEFLNRGLAIASAPPSEGQP